MVHIYNEITIYIYKEIFPSGASLAPDPPTGGIAFPQTPQGGNPPALPRVEECTFFWGVKSSWGINTMKTKTSESGR
jgi:hypothetical protein